MKVTVAFTFTDFSEEFLPPELTFSVSQAGVLVTYMHVPSVSVRTHYSLAHGSLRNCLCGEDALHQGETYSSSRSRAQETCEATTEAYRTLTDAGSRDTETIRSRP